MHELVLRITDPKKCYIFAENATRKGHPELALQAYRRAVDLRAEQHTPGTEAARAAIRAVYAYEEALSHTRGKRTRATGTWQMVNRHGVFAAISKRVAGRSVEDVTPALKALGMEDYSFTAVCSAYPEIVAEQEAA
jgi:hypothetical protein